MASGETARRPCSAENVVELLDRSAMEFPERPAIEDSSGRAISYGELATLSLSVQSHLTAAGVLPGDRVGVLMRKSIDALVAFQAILRSGAAYVPADPLAPTGRAASILKDCDAAAIFVDKELAAPLQGELMKLGFCAPMLVPAESGKKHAWRMESLTDATSARPVPISPKHLSFLLYTSGSTGVPKGVMLTHGNVLSFVDWCSSAFAPTPSDKFAVHAPLHFSLSVFNLYVAWKHGGTVVLIDDQTARTPELLGPAIETGGISVWFSTPTILSLLAQSGVLPSLKLDTLRLIMFAGEPFQLRGLRSLMKQVPRPRYVHVFGSTETHIMASYDVPRKIPATRTSPLPIGKVCPHFKSRIVDEEGNDVGPQTDGELCLTGPGVTPGYWKSVSQDRRAFFVDPGGQRWYRTGDIVRLETDGNLIHRCRRDRMIKKRGYRIELAEIEACLCASALVREAAVLAVPDPDLGLKVHAFVVPSEEARPTIIELKAHCARVLPSYMVPDSFAFLGALPRTSTGKIDFPMLKNRV